jgi:hypothetical protein
MNYPDIDWRLVGAIACRTKLDSRITHCHICDPTGSLGALLLFTSLGTGTLTRDMYTNSTLNRRLANRFKQLKRFFSYGAIIIGSDRQLDLR